MLLLVFFSDTAVLDFLIGTTCTVVPLPTTPLLRLCFSSKRKTCQAEALQENCSTCSGYSHCVLDWKAGPAAVVRRWIIPPHPHPPLPYNVVSQRAGWPPSWRGEIPRLLFFWFVSYIKLESSQIALTDTKRVLTCCYRAHMKSKQKIEYHKRNKSKTHAGLCPPAFRFKSRPLMRWRQFRGAVSMNHLFCRLYKWRYDFIRSHMVKYDECRVFGE